MSKIHKNLTDLIGKTPLLELNRYKEKYNLHGNIIGKLEYFNPAGSVKDRIAASMIEQAERDNIINKDTIIIEPTSGNTGIGLAAVAASKGYKIILTMPETMSVERRNLLRAYNAEIILTDGSKGMKGAITKAQELKTNYKNSFIPSQFSNPANPQIHYKTTAEEIWNDTDGKIDILVSGVGTGGTITGVGKFLKEKDQTIKIVAVEPSSSPVLSGGSPTPHKIQGIGAGFIPEILDTNIYDQIITVQNEDAFEHSKRVAHTEGILVGISSGAVIYAATLLAKDQTNANKNIVVILPDTGERYLSTDLFK